MKSYDPMLSRFSALVSIETTFESADRLRNGLDSVITAETAQIMLG